MVVREFIQKELEKYQKHPSYTRIEIRKEHDLLTDGVIEDCTETMLKYMDYAVREYCYYCDTITIYI